MTNLFRVLEAENPHTAGGFDLHQFPISDFRFPISDFRFPTSDLRPSYVRSFGIDRSNRTASFLIERAMAGPSQVAPFFGRTTRSSADACGLAGRSCGDLRRGMRLLPATGQKPAPV